MTAPKRPTSRRSGSWITQAWEAASTRRGTRLVGDAVGGRSKYATDAAGRDAGHHIGRKVGRVMWSVHVEQAQEGVGLGSGTHGTGVAPECAASRRRRWGGHGRGHGRCTEGGNLLGLGLRERLESGNLGVPLVERLRERVGAGTELVEEGGRGHDHAERRDVRCPVYKNI